MSGKKVALVTGASRGIGRALSEALVERGYLVYGGARSWSADEKTGFTRLKLDVSDPGSAQEAVERAVGEQGRLDLLVNNAGVGQSGSVEETKLSALREVFEINYQGPVNMIRAALPRMREQGSGVIVNVGSVAGKIGLPFQGHYSASKFALEGLSESLYHELKPFGIRVVLIEPGDVGTEIWSRTEHLIPEGSPYAPWLEKFHEVKRKEMGEKADPPEKVARQIIKAIESRSGRLRWPAARGAGLILTGRKLLPDRLFLRLVAGNYGLLKIR